MKRILAVLACLILSPSVVAQEATGEPITFVDSRAFDARLSKELGRGGKRVEVQVEGRLSINQIPVRLDKWLTRVTENGLLELRLQDTTIRNKSLLSLASMVFPALQGMQDEAMLRTANDYNAIIYYRKEANGDALVDRVVFLKR